MWWWHRPLDPAFRRQRQQISECEASQVYIVNGGVEFHPLLPLCLCVKGSHLVGLATG